MSDLMKPQDGKTFIATYGSLRRKMQNFRVNASGNGEFVGKGKTLDNYDLYRYGGAYFPSVSLVHNVSNKQVVVDVFEAPEGRSGLEGSYDSLEGYPNFYNRTQIVVELDDGCQLLAWIYHIDEEQSDRIESGDWCEHNVPDYYNSL